MEEGAPCNDKQRKGRRAGREHVAQGTAGQAVHDQRARPKAVRRAADDEAPGSPAGGSDAPERRALSAARFGDSQTIHTPQQTVPRQCRSHGRAQPSHPRPLRYLSLLSFRSLSPSLPDPRPLRHSDAAHAACGTNFIRLARPEGSVCSKNRLARGDALQTTAIKHSGARPCSAERGPGEQPCASQATSRQHVSDVCDVAVEQVSRRRHLLRDARRRLRDRLTAREPHVEHDGTGDTGASAVRCSEAACRRKDGAGTGRARRVSGAHCNGVGSRDGPDRLSVGAKS